MAKTDEIFVLDKKVRLLQPVKGFRTSLDSVMLAAACPAGAGDRVLDMGSGVGSASFCLLERVADCFVTGVDIQPDTIDLANRNAALNNKTERCDFICLDIRTFEADQPEDRFDHVICNPPYLDSGHHISSPVKGVATAKVHVDMELKDWINAGFRLLKPGGSLTVIHRADATDRIIRGLGRRFGAIEIIPLWPKKGIPAKRVIIRAKKDRKSPTVFHQGVILHDSQGNYTKEAENILREAGAIALKNTVNNT